MFEHEDAVGCQNRVGSRENAIVGGIVRRIEQHDVERHERGIRPQYLESPSHGRADHSIAGLYSAPREVPGEQRLRAGVVLAADGRIQLAHLWNEETPGGARPRASSRPPPRPLSDEDAALRTELVAKLGEHGGNITRVSEALGKRRTTVQRWMRKLGIDPERFR